MPGCGARTPSTASSRTSASPNAPAGAPCASSNTCRPSVPSGLAATAWCCSRGIIASGMCASPRCAAGPPGSRPWPITTAVIPECHPAPLIVDPGAIVAVGFSGDLARAGDGKYFRFIHKTPISPKLPTALPMASITPHRDGWRVQVYVRGHRDSRVFPGKREAARWGHSGSSSCRG